MVAARKGGQVALGMNERREKPRDFAFLRAMSHEEQPARKLGILGSTGSIGTQALEVLDALAGGPCAHDVHLLTAQHNWQLLAKQALKYKPQVVVITKEAHYQDLKQALTGTSIEVRAGEAALIEAAGNAQLDILLTAVVGFAGLRPTLAAIEAGTHIALANKETLVVAGRLITKLAAEKGVQILPVDSEHSALFQCLVGEPSESVSKIILTASGGPFRGYSAEQLASVSLEQALKHPNWAMGAKVTIDSASMMNKGLEVIEARWLFNLPAKQIDIVVHPQSIVHSVVEFEDGSMKAQLGTPDMRTPIQYALTHPQRAANAFPRFSFMDYPQLTFEPIDARVFRAVAYAYDSLRACGNKPCILNAANEVANAAFREGQLRFVEIYDRLEAALSRMPYLPEPSLEDLLQTDRETRALVAAL